MTTYTQFRDCDAQTGNGLSRALAYGNVDEAHRDYNQPEIDLIVGCLDAPAETPSGGMMAFECLGQLMVAPWTTQRAGWRAS